MSIISENQGSKGRFEPQLQADRSGTETFRSQSVTTTGPLSSPAQLLGSYEDRVHLLQLCGNKTCVARGSTRLQGLVLREGDIIGHLSPFASKKKCTPTKPRDSVARLFLVCFITLDAPSTYAVPIARSGRAPHRSQPAHMQRKAAGSSNEDMCGTPRLFVVLRCHQPRRRGRC
jgi:hypothetical protein